MIVEINMDFIIRGKVMEEVDVGDCSKPVARARAQELLNERKAAWTSMGFDLRNTIVLATIQKDAEGTVIRWFEGEANVANHIIRLGRPPDHVIVELKTDKPEDIDGS